MIFNNYLTFYFFILEKFLLLGSIFNACNHAKYVFLNNQQCMIQPTFISFYPNEYSQGLRYYPLTVNLDRSVEISNTLNVF